MDLGHGLGKPFMHSGLGALGVLLVLCLFFCFFGPGLLVEGRACVEKRMNMKGMGGIV